MTAPRSYRSDPRVPAFPDDRPLIVFDGECGFCSRWVRFLLKHDRAGRIRFASAQSALGTALLVHYGYQSDDYETAILIADGKAWFKSDGALRAVALLGLPWLPARLLLAVPKRLRDRAYDIVARNRMRIAGRLERCFVPTPQERDRFLS
ncbi:MAG: thiol-disulfide oxidoreductase DCC family protein [Shinella sp.]|nr:thiol-disulfide oxidoreductase DCC family protein [Shinella sp.]